MEVSICVPVLKRYDMLIKLIESIEVGHFKPTRYVIVDNGTKIDNYQLPKIAGEYFIQRPGLNAGVAGSWNFFINNFPDIRIICNDDIVFQPDAIENFVNQFDENYMMCPMLANAFSCFMLPDKVVKLVGLFDEKISPNYGYFEDDDYSRRMSLLGINLKLTNNVRVWHHKSSTLESYTSAERDDHNRRFNIARSNYNKKWGGIPRHETLETPRQL
jgi:GT2 family glycosyltransferase